MLSLKLLGKTGAKKSTFGNNSAFAWRVMYNNRLGIICILLITISVVNFWMRGHPSPWRKFYLRNMQAKHFNCSEGDRLVGSVKVSIASLKKALRNSPRSLCNCGFSHEDLDPNQTYLASHSSAEASVAGGGQNIVSYSLYAKSDMTDTESDYFQRRYFKGIKINLEGIKRHYQGWGMRIYSNMTLNENLCKIVCLDRRVYFCDVRLHGNLKNIHPMTWRYLPLGDATVSKFISRDLDSTPSEREANAVREWIHSGYPFHAMRDHHYHLTQMLGGMWGASNEKLCWKYAKVFLKQIMNGIQSKEEELDDQSILTRTIYWKMRGGVLVHDSYLCNVYQDSLPFPSKRPSKFDWIGKIVIADDGVERAPLSPLTKKCPIECRPPHGLDWDYC